MQTKDIAYRCGDKTLTGYLADGAGGKPAPGVVLVHQGGGLTEHTRERARMLAELGYVAFALDMYGEMATGREHAMALLNGLVGERTLWRARFMAGLEVLKQQPNVDATRLAAIGFCFGGMTVIEMARETPELACIVAFHPGMTHLPGTDARPVTCKVMVCAGADDPLIPPDARSCFAKLMTEAGADWQFILYGGAGHSFTDRSVDAMGIPHFSYHEQTDHRSWTAMRGLFDETLGAV